MLATNAKRTAHGKSCTNSPKGPVIILVIGKNIPQIAMVASDIGTKRSDVLTFAAYQRE